MASNNLFKFKETIDSLKKRRDMLENQLLTAKKLYDNLENQRKATENEISSVNVETEFMSLKIKDDKKAHLEIQNMFQIYEQQIKQLGQALQNINQLLDVLNNLELRNERGMKVLKRILANLVEKNKMIDQVHEEGQKAFKKMSDELAEKKQKYLNEVASSKKEKAQLEKSLDGLTENNKKLKNEYQSSLEKLDQTNKRVDEKILELQKEMEQNKAIVYAKIEEKENHLQELRAKKEKILLDQLCLQDKIKSLKGEHGDKSRLNRALEKRVKEKRVSLMELAKKHEEQLHIKESLMKEYELWRVQREEQLKKFSEQKEKHKNLINGLERKSDIMMEVEEMKLSLQNSENEIAMIEKSVEFKEREEKKVDLQIEELAGKVKEIKINIENDKHEVENIQQKSLDNQKEKNELNVAIEMTFEKTREVEEKRFQVHKDIQSITSSGIGRCFQNPKN